MRLHRFAIITSIAAFFLIIAGGLVTSTGSGLSVPDWPLSFGKLMPPMTGGVFYEHGHRVVATLVGILTVILAFWLMRVEARRWVKVLGFATLGAVIVQGVLGGLTVLLRLPVAVSVAHAALAQSVFCCTVVLALATSPAWQTHVATGISVRTQTQRYTIITAALIFIQLIFGALMRHSGAGMAIPDFPLAYGTLIPPMDNAGIAAINAARETIGLSPVTAFQVEIHFLHRVGAVLVFLAAIATTVHVLWSYPSEGRVREPAIVLMLLIVFQIVIGALTIWTGKGVEVSTIHVATGALIFATSVVLSVRVSQLYRIPGALKES